MYSNDNTYIEQLKTAMSGNGDDELAKRYREALKLNNAAFERTKGELEATLIADRNEAAAQSKRNERDYAEFLASRGLSRSGESAQAKLASGLTLSNTLSRLSAARTKAVSDANLARQRADFDALSDYTQDKSELESKWISAAAEELENRRKADEQLKAEEDAASAAHAKAEENAHDSTLPQNDEPAKAQKITPELNAEEMAKNILKSSCYTGTTIKGLLDNSYARVTLEGIKRKYDLGDDYLNSMDLILKSNGYTDMTLDEAEARVAVSKAKSKYKSWRDLIFNVLKQSASTRKQALADAEKEAVEKQKEFLYTHCSTREAFEAAWLMMGFQAYPVQKFYDAVEKGGIYSLGMSITY